MSSRSGKSTPRSPHAIDDIRMRRGHQSWSICHCGETFHAKTPELLKLMVANHVNEMKGVGI